MLINFFSVSSLIDACASICEICCSASFTIVFTSESDGVALISSIAFCSIGFNCSIAASFSSLVALGV